MPIPRPALILGLLGLLPFLWGALTLYLPFAARLTIDTVGVRYTGAFLLLSYGAMILAFMSGVIWGFSTRADGRVAQTGYILAVIPALWSFFARGYGPTTDAILLIAGFVGLLGIDWLFQAHHLAPPWWLKLRLLLTAVVVACLATLVV